MDCYNCNQGCDQNHCPESCPGPCPKPCPLIPTLQSLHVENKTPQAGTTTLTDIKLGTTAYTTGNAITYTAPDTIHLIKPGLYKVFYTASILLNVATDKVLIEALLNDSAIPGSELYVTGNKAGDSVPYDKTFYVYNTAASTLQFAQLATSTSDTIVSFTVTVIKVQ